MNLGQIRGWPGNGPQLLNNRRSRCLLELAPCLAYQMPAFQRSIARGAPVTIYARWKW
ncbi:hypothetical protein KPLM21_370002 [Klebsiella pneumoniae]|nr:hypothetical protein KPLM21_370002 [Klebsiella pneumoniae]